MMTSATRSHLISIRKRNDEFQARRAFVNLQPSARDGSVECDGQGIG